jgi:hypothetical protein
LQYEPAGHGWAADERATQNAPVGQGVGAMLMTVQNPPEVHAEGADEFAGQ